MENFNNGNENRNPERDTDSGWLRYRQHRREERRLRRRKRSVGVMLVVMVAAVIMAIVNAVSPRHHTVPEPPRIETSIITPELIQKLDSATDRLQQMMRMLFGGDNVPVPPDMECRESPAGPFFVVDSAARKPQRMSDFPEAFDFPGALFLDFINRRPWRDSL